jgi:endonuclease III
MTITLKPEQEQVLIEAINSGLAQTTDEALDQALEALRERLPQRQAPVDDSVAVAARSLATFGKRHGLSLGWVND